MTPSPQWRATRAVWPLPAGLILLSFVPVLAGALRVTQLATGATVTPENARFFAEPVPVVIHIIGATTFAILGALQLTGGFRRSRPRWHRVAGRVVVPAGLAVALSGMWMAVDYPEPAEDNDLLKAFRLLFGTAMAVSITLGFRAIRRRDIGAHRAWMIRGYAIGLGAGTQVLTRLPWTILVGGPITAFPNALLMLAGWLINVAVAEWVIHRTHRPLRSAAFPAKRRANDSRLA